MSEQEDAVLSLTTRETLILSFCESGSDSTMATVMGMAFWFVTTVVVSYDLVRLLPEQAGCSVRAQHMGKHSAAVRGVSSDKQTHLENRPPLPVTVLGPRYSTLTEGSMPKNAWNSSPGCTSFSSEHVAGRREVVRGAERFEAALAVCAREWL